MTLLSAVKKLPRFLYNEILKDQSFVDGDCFERFVRKYIFQKEDFDIWDMTHDYSINKTDYIYSSLNPDYRLFDNKAGRDFYLECKWRSSFTIDNKLTWCNDEQLNRYKIINKHTPVYVIIGLGGTSSNPEFLFLIPISKVNYTGLFEYFLKPYDISNLKYITSTQLWNLG